MNINFRKFRGITILILIIMLFSLSRTVYAETNNNDNSSKDKNIVEYIDTEMNKLVDSKLTKGITASVVKNQKLVLGKGYGYADEKNGIKVDPEKSTFKIGSVSKTFVALAAMQLVEQGKLDMNAPVTKYLGAEFPKFKYPITMENLLTHTAGFEDMYSPLEVESEKELISLKEFVTKYRPNQFFEPGEVSAYSNYGISLSGYVIERISGMSFYDYADEKIFKPLEMNNTTYKLAPKGIMSKAYSPAGVEKADALDHSYPAGSVTSTGQDMAKYIEFLLGGNSQGIIKDESRQKMFAKNFAMDNELSGIGYVWQRHEINGHTFYEHGGGTANFTSILAIYPEQNMGIFISCNQISKFELAEYAFVVAEMLYGKDKEKDAYTGVNSRDISGYYVPARSSFKGADKFVDFLLYGVPKHITGNSTEGFAIDGNKLMPVGEDAYKEKNLGYIKFIQKGNNLYYSPKQFYTSYIRVPWYEGTNWQLFVMLFFIAASLIGFIISVVLMISGLLKKNKRLILANIPAIAVFVLFISMITRFIFHIDYMNEVFGGMNCTAGLDKVISFYKVEALLIAISGLCGIVATVYMWLNKRNVFIRLFSSIWSIAVVLFISWLVQMNLIG